MTIGAIMQRPAIKAERPDLAYLPQNYYQQQLQTQQQLQQQIQLQQLQNQQRLVTPPNSRTQNHTNQTILGQKPNQSSPAVVKVPEADLEKQPDFPSIKGVFGWTTVDNVNLPYILRGDKQFVSVRIVEMKLLCRYPNSYPDDLGKQAPLTSFFITVNEAKLLNEINLHHCAGEYGKKEFTTKDLIVLLSDFINFYNLVKKTFPDAAAARQQAAQETAGWLQIKNTVTPYVKRQNSKFVPLSVIQYAAGLLTKEKVSGLPPTKIECELLNEACKTAGVEFVFSDNTTRLINVTDILKITPVDIIELPTINPLKHATYMELPTSSHHPHSAEKPKVPVPCRGPRPAQPYLFQPNSQTDLIRSQIQATLPRHDQPGARYPVPAHTAVPGGQMMDPRLAEMYRMQYPAQSKLNGTQNVRPGPLPYNHLLPQMNPMMQYYLGMQNNQNARHQSPAGQSGTPNPVQPLVTGADYNSSRSPGAISNPSPRSRTPSQSRPPSNSRQPSESPLGSPLSPNLPNFSPAGLRPNSMGGYSVADTVTQSGMHGNISLQQMQSMFLQRFPLPEVSAGNHPPPYQLGMLGHPSQNHMSKTVPAVPANIHPPGQQGVENGANQEIPGLFSPTGPTQSAPKASDSVVTESVQTVTSSVSKDVNCVSQTNTVKSVTSVSVSSVSASVSQEVPAMPAPRNQPLPTTISAAKPQTTLVNSISGSWLNNKSISCLYLEQDEERKGPYCLVEAVCKLYFNGCSVNEFLFALENVLNVPLLTCNDSEEKAFIQYYNLPVLTLKCNKMIKFDDLEKYFPQLTYMFPSKEVLAQSEGDTVNSGISDTGDVLPVNGALSTEELDATIQGRVSPAGNKRQNETAENGPPAKQQRTEGEEASVADDDDAVIILD